MTSRIPQRHRAFATVKPPYLRGQRWRLLRIRHPFVCAFLAMIAVCAILAAAVAWL